MGCQPISLAKCPPCDNPPEVTCDSFSLCVGNQTLSYDGVCVAVAPRADFQIPDGTWVPTFANGCIVGVQALPACEYTPPDCCSGSDPIPPSPSPLPVVLDPDMCNLLQWRGTELYGGVYIEPGNGISVTGCGSASDPYQINVVSYGDAPLTQVVALSSDGGTIVITGTGTSTDPLYIGHVAKGQGAGTYGGITVDAYGHIVSISGAGQVTGIVGGDGIAVSSTDEGIYTISLAGSGSGGATGTISVGGLEVTVQNGLIKNITTTPITQAGQIYTPNSPDGTISARIIDYDQFGFITNIVPA